MAPLVSATQAELSVWSNTVATGRPGSFVLPTWVPASPLNCASAFDPAWATQSARNPAVSDVGPPVAGNVAWAPDCRFQRTS